MVRRADTNNNNTLEREELENGYGRPVRFMAERAGLNVSQSLRVDEVVSAIERSRGMSSSSSSSSGSSSAPATANPQAFGTPSQVGLVPGFDGGTTTAAGTVANAAQSNLPLEQRFEERILERAKDRMREYDRDGNGFMEGDELANYRGDPPILTSDLNKDNKISLEEMAQRYQARYSGSSSYGGSSYGGSGGPSGFSGYSSGGYPGSSSSSSSSYRPPYSSSSSGPTMMMSSTSRPPFPSPSSTSSSPSSISGGSPSSSDRFREFAQSMIRRSDRNNSGKLEKDEWRDLRDPESTDANRDGVITVEEMTARMSSRMSGGGDGGGRGGPPGFGGGPPGFGGPGGPSFGDRGRDGDRGSSYGDRGGDRGSSSDRGGSDRGGSGDRGSDFSRRSGGPGGFSGGPSGPGGPGGFSGGPGGPGGFSSSSGGGSGSSSSRGSSSSSRGSDPAAPKTSYRVTTAAELLPRGLDSWFTRSDTDGDGQVSMSEYAAKWDADAAKKFQSFDANGDGFISADEALRSGPSSRR